MGDGRSRGIRNRSGGHATAVKPSHVGRLWKRGLDICVAAVAVVVTAPALVVASVAVRAFARPGSMFARQPRLGAFGRPITVLKLRMLPESAELSRVEGSVARGITRAVSAMRLDELPLLLSVVRGDLSLVGPAARDPRRVDWADPIQRKVLAAKPGLTGL